MICDKIYIDGHLKCSEKKKTKENNFVSLKKKTMFNIDIMHSYYLFFRGGS